MKNLKQDIQDMIKILGLQIKVKNYKKEMNYIY